MSSYPLQLKATSENELEARHALGSIGFHAETMRVDEIRNNIGHPDDPSSWLSIISTEVIDYSAESATKAVALDYTLEAFIAVSKQQPTAVGKHAAKDALDVNKSVKAIADRARALPGTYQAPAIPSDPEDAQEVVSVPTEEPEVTLELMQQLRDEARRLVLRDADNPTKLKLFKSRAKGKGDEATKRAKISQDRATKHYEDRAGHLNGRRLNPFSDSPRESFLKEDKERHTACQESCVSEIMQVVQATSGSLLDAAEPVKRKLPDILDEIGRQKQPPDRARLGWEIELSTVIGLIARPAGISEAMRSVIVEGAALDLSTEEWAKKVRAQAENEIAAGALDIGSALGAVSRRSGEEPGPKMIEQANGIARGTIGRADARIDSSGIIAGRHKRRRVRGFCGGDDPLPINAKQVGIELKHLPNDEVLRHRLVVVVEYQVEPEQVKLFNDGVEYLLRQDGAVDEFFTLPEAWQDFLARRQRSGERQAGQVQSGSNEHKPEPAIPAT